MSRLVFMGSPAFAVPTLEALAREHELLAVFAQPDKPAGRGRTLTRVPVAAWADEHGVPVHQPHSLRKDPSAIETLRALRPDVVVVVAYGLILPQLVLDVAPHGCLNVHASLLPRHRGAAPIPAAILAGDAETGVTIMRMDAGVDTGSILAQAREPIHPDDTTATLGARLAEIGARLMAETLPRYLRGEIEPVSQDHASASLSPKIEKGDGRIDWSRPATEIDRMIRAYTPWPGASTQWKGADLKIARAVPTGQTSAPELHTLGQVIRLDGERIGVVTGDGVLELREVQLAGKRAMSIEEFVRGQPRFVGATLA
ncbi:MAG TPA: methionyl-tRNA formyltransferase [Anaerolineae bacterium]|nr:methionyl-tRNA formyltransferase [Anaerolineae bacterium]